MPATSFPRLLSRPAKVYWAGFESDTFTLQREGWDLSASQDPMRGTMQIAMRHEKAQMYAISEITEWRFQQTLDYRYGDMMPPAYLRMESVGGQIYSRALTSARDWNFAPIDATPVFADEPIRSIEDLIHFATFKPKKIILPPDTVPDLMKRILELQEPGREKFFLEQAKRSAEPTLHAQIFSLAS